MVVTTVVGERPRRFLLDTGAGTTCVLADDADLMALAGSVAPSSSGVFATASADEMVVLPRLALGPIVREALPVRRLREQGARPFPDLLGMDVLGRHALLLRPAAARLLIDPLAENRPATTLPLPATTVRHVSLPVVIGGATARGIWDTGASMTVVDAGLVARHPDHSRLVGESRGMDSSGEVMTTPTYLVSGMTIGGVPFAPHPVAAIDLGPLNAMIPEPMDLIVGNTTITQADWWIDVPAGRWAVLPHG